MIKNNLKKRILWLLNKLLSILPMFFWSFLIFGFESPTMAIITLLCAAAHELGHLTCIAMYNRSSISIKGVINGFRINGGRKRSYKEEIMTYASGPMANILLCLLFSFTYPILGPNSALIATINIATAISNLLPIKGYDGYGIIRTVIEKRNPCSRSLTILSGISSSLIFAFCIISLYFIDRKGGGYWIFAIFFVSMIKHIGEELGERFSIF